LPAPTVSNNGGVPPDRLGCAGQWPSSTFTPGGKELKAGLKKEGEAIPYMGMFGIGFPIKAVERGPVMAITTAKTFYS
jgi:hypothetical protein